MVTPSPKFTFDIAGRLPPKTESAVYAIVTALVGSAPGSQISISREGDTVRVLADGSASVPEYVLDRLGAAGGSSARGREGLELVLPCA